MSGDQFIADDPTRGREDAFQSVTCTVCGRVHLVNAKTGKVVGDRGQHRHHDSTSNRYFAEHDNPPDCPRAIVGTQCKMFKTIDLISDRCVSLAASRRSDLH